jgi:hypothetical protein
VQSIAPDLGRDARARLAKLFGLLGSDQAGERSNAIEAIGKTLAASGLSWSWVCELVASGVRAEDPEAVARDRVLTRLVGERVTEAVFGIYSLNVEEHAQLRKVNNELRELRSLRGLTSREIVHAIDLADLVRTRVGRRW